MGYLIIAILMVIAVSFLLIQKAIDDKENLSCEEVADQAQKSVLDSDSNIKVEEALGHKKRGVMEKKRSAGVTIFGWYLILQGWIGVGQINKFPFASVVVVLFISIGIGFLKLYKPAYITSVVMFSCILIWASILAVEYGKISTRPYAGIIFSVLFLIFLLRPAIRKQFYYKTNK